jgi:hypothetical protein
MGNAADGPHPGLYPLRPLRTGEILGAAFRIARRSLGVLAPIALIAELVSSAALLGVLAANGALTSYATGEQMSLPSNPTPEQISSVVDYVVHNVLGALATFAIALITAPILAGFATPFAALAATTRTAPNGAAMARLTGRVPVLLGLGVVVGLATAVGYLLLIIPGVILWLMLLPAGPVAAMERLSISDSIKRATVVSRGFKGRLFVVSVLSALIAGAVTTVATSVLGAAISTADPVQRLFLTQGLGVLVGALVTPWTATVTAMLYVDIRMRREGLADALRATAR